MRLHKQDQQFPGIWTWTKVERPKLDPSKSTWKVQQHEACSYCYIMVQCDGQTKPPVQYCVWLQSSRTPPLGTAGGGMEDEVSGDQEAMRMTLEDLDAYNTATCVKGLLRVTLSGTTATSQENTRGIPQCLQPEAASEPKHHHHPCSVPQLPPLDADHKPSGGPHLLHPQQHAVNTVQPWAAAVHRQWSVPGWWW